MLIPQNKTWNTLFTCQYLHVRYGPFIPRTFWAAASVPGCHGSWVRESSSDGCRCPPYSVLFVWVDMKTPDICMQGWDFPQHILLSADKPCQPRQTPPIQITGWVTQGHQQHPATFPFTSYSVLYTLLLSTLNFLHLTSDLKPHYVLFLLQSIYMPFTSKSLLSTSINASAFVNA